MANSDDEQRSVRLSRGWFLRDAFAAAELTLIHLNPTLTDHSLLLEDATPTFERVVIGEDRPSWADQRVQSALRAAMGHGAEAAKSPLARTLQ
jgi:hypothetical protein